MNMIKYIMCIIRVLSVNSQYKIEKSNGNPNPTILEPPTVLCPDVMCMTYCPYGHQIGETGCQMCECNPDIPKLVTGEDCILQQPSCEGYLYVCPKLTEITNCNQDGIFGYTTYSLSLLIKPNINIDNIYAIYGTQENKMNIPPAYNSETEFNSNIGGTSEFIKNYSPNTAFDSWLTIGITDGNGDNDISSIGVDFSDWTVDQGIIIDNGAVFSMDPSLKIVAGREYIIAQLTVRTDEDYQVIINVQGKTLINTDNIDDKMWDEMNVVFPLISPTTINHYSPPISCILWYDGCNTCSTNNGVIGVCSRVMCFTEGTPRCIQYVSGH